MGFNWKQALAGMVAGLSVWSAGQAMAANATRCIDRGDRVVLRFNDVELRTRGSFDPVFLRRQVNQLCGRGTLRAAESVRVIAKSRAGRGQAYLEAGRFGAGEFTTRNARVGGSPSDFFSSEGFTFDRINFSIPRGYRQLGFRIYLRGNIILRRVVIFKAQRGGGGGGFGDSIRLTCESQNFRYSECRIPGRANLRNAQVRLLRQLSSATCVQNRNFGLDDTRGTLWVDEGCRGEFEVLLGRGGRGRIGL